MRIHESRGSLAARAIIAAVVLGGAVWLLLTSPIFSIREIRVEGESEIQEGVLIRLAAVAEGENLITLAIEDVVRRLERHAWIAEAAVDRDLPSTLILRVVERRPRGWADDPSGPVILAGDGTVLERAGRKPQALPHIGSWPEALVPGGSIDGLAEELRVVGVMPPRLLRLVESADLDDGDVTLVLRDGGTVLYGAPSDVTAKAEALTGIIRWAEGEGIEPGTIDVRVPSVPSLSPANGKRITVPISESRAL